MCCCVAVDRANANSPVWELSLRRHIKWNEWQPMEKQFNEGNDVSHFKSRENPDLAKIDLALIWERLDSLAEYIASEMQWTHHIDPRQPVRRALMNGKLEIAILSSVTSNWNTYLDDKIAKDDVIWCRMDGRFSVCGVKQVSVHGVCVHLEHSCYTIICCADLTQIVRLGNEFHRTFPKQSFVCLGLQF